MSNLESICCIFAHITPVVVDEHVCHDDVEDGDEEAGQRDGERVEEVAADLVEVEPHDDEVGVGAGDEALELGAVNRVAVHKVRAHRSRGVAAALKWKKVFISNKETME